MDERTFFIANILGHIAGLLLAALAIMKTRTPQGAVAWALSLVLIPSVAIPLYVIFGLKKFEGYVRARRIQSKKLAEVFHRLRQDVPRFRVDLKDDKERLGVFEELADMVFVRGNGVKILIDGKETFDAILAGVDAAREYVLMQFYIVRHDGLGQRIKEALIRKALQGVRVYLLYDAIGAKDLGNKYVEELRQAGVKVTAFKSTKTIFKGRFQLNFRNHRKIVVVDGKEAYVGGHNVGDEYLGLDPKLGRWRDTHVKVTGGAALQAQVSFLEDWYWSTGEIPEMRWELVPDERDDDSVLMVPTGPTDIPDACGLFFMHSINLAKKRLWISTPYFVPDNQVISALKLAALRGVDVRLLIAGVTDNELSRLASFGFLPDVLQWGIKVYRYRGGFLHQKALLVDDDYAVIGTANFDNRSFRLNFEILVLFAGEVIAKDLERIFLMDFDVATATSLQEVESLPLWFQFKVKAASLLAPIL